MSQGSQAFYVVTEAIKDYLIDDSFVNTTTYGSLSDIDLNKQTIFPLCHIQINNATLQAGAILFNVSVLAMDLVYDLKIDSNDGTSDSTFYGVDNEQDVLNSTLFVLNKLNKQLMRGTLRSSGYELQGTSSCEPFVDRFANKVAGWALTFNVFVQSDIDRC
jgi:hypothetical protein